MRGAWFFRKAQPSPSLDNFPTVAVLIPARNEAANIEQCLATVLAQNYPTEKLEIFLVNDHSTDATAEIAERIAAEHSQLQVLHLAEEGINSYKKAAIALGVKRAKGEIILQTDADCVAGPDWVRSMASHFGPETALVSGPVELVPGSTLFERLQSLESMGLVALGAGSLRAGHPNMANGANFAYRKSVFEAVQGFEGQEAVASGDDELLLQKIHLAGYEMDFAKSQAAIVRTSTLSSWKAFKAQRIRWVSKSRAYLNRWANLTQVASYLAFLSFPVLGIAGYWEPMAWRSLGVFFILKFLIDLYLMGAATAFFQRKPLRWLLPLLQIAYIPYVLWIGLVGTFSTSYRWKERTVT